MTWSHGQYLLPSISQRHRVLGFIIPLYELAIRIAQNIFLSSGSSHHAILFNTASHTRISPRTAVLVGTGAQATISPHTTSCRYRPAWSLLARNPSLPATNSLQWSAISCNTAPASCVCSCPSPKLIHLPIRERASESQRGFCGRGAEAFLMSSFEVAVVEVEVDWHRANCEKRPGAFGGRSDGRRDKDSLVREIARIVKNGLDSRILSEAMIWEELKSELVFGP